MAAIEININFQKFSDEFKKKLAIISDREYLLRPVAIELITEITNRIHQKGLASNGTPIGTYSTDYMKVREKNNRSTDRKVIISLTRQLENDWSVLATQRGYGIGFKNSINAKKIGWVEDQKGKVITDLSKEEFDYALDRINELVNAAINS